MNSESTTPSNAPFLALWNHFKDELLASDAESFEDLKRERVINFFGIPWAIEKSTLGDKKSAPNAAINSYSNALLTLLLSNQFIEIKGSVFKRFEKENLFQLSCSDIVERFQLALFLTVITARNLIELSGSPISPFSILPTSFIPLFPAMTTVETLLTPVIIVFASELIVDWLKHAFITKFNQIRPSIYDRYIDILSRDLVVGNEQKSENQKKFTDPSLLVSRRIGFAALPLACLTIRVSSQTMTMISDSIQEMDSEERSNLPFTIVFTQPSGVWIFCGFAAFVILTFIKLLVGINILGFANRRYASMERREAEELARAEELDAKVAKEKENQLSNEILDDPRDNVLDQEMEFLIGITGKDFVLTAADTSAARSITVMKSTEDKSCDLNKHNIMLYSGESGDTVNFAEYIQRNVRLYGIRNGIELTPKAAATFTRKELATSLRSRHPYTVFLLIAGYDITTSKPHLYWIDYLGSSIEVPFAAHGYGAYYCMSILDRYHHPDLTLDEAKVLIKKCIDELKSRFVFNLLDFKIKVTDQDGIREIDLKDMKD
ncbi:498_t:CDS:10 [Dentiscutata erythropus]|uniref:498_t:CDS:1 n=1 Tax=Dentiscutata erythropus TaxID=1348616 RepID=A0A9N8ZTG7_9GLOM|nr:498_t:CDS:10 [Dentiscutata erythropus]